MSVIHCPRRNDQRIEPALPVMEGLVGRETLGVDWHRICTPEFSETSVPDHPGARGPMLVIAARACVRMFMIARSSVLMSFLFHDHGLIRAQLISLIGDTRMRVHVGNLRSTDRARGLSAAIGTIEGFRPAVHGLEFFERTAFSATIFI